VPKEKKMVMLGSMVTQSGDWCYTLWLQVVRILPVDESANSSLAVVNYRHFLEKKYQF
jgi:hypothetical protein